MRIAGIERFSTVDYPGMLSAVVFTAGCTWNCWYCQNKMLLSACPTVPTEDVMAFLKKRAGLLEAVTVTGGEPTMQPDLIDFLKEVRALGYRIKLDTNGSAPEVVRTVCRQNLADYVAVDLKAPPDQYDRIGCGSATDVLRTIEALRETGNCFEVRTTVLPGIDAVQLREMCAYAGPVPLYALQVYRKKGMAYMSRPELEQLACAVADLVPCLTVRA